MIDYVFRSCGLVQIHGFLRKDNLVALRLSYLIVAFCLIKDQNLAKAKIVALTKSNYLSEVK